MTGPFLCPGRTTLYHNNFLADYPEINMMGIVGVDIGSADLLYASSSEKITLCSKEQFHLELHKFLAMRSAHQHVKKLWEEVFDSGRDWQTRGRLFAHYNKRYRRKKFKTWSDAATFYCILAMSGFRVHYKDNMLYGEHCPQTPDYAFLKKWAFDQRRKQIMYSNSDISTFNTLGLDNNSVLYLHLPSQYGSYGYGYKWTKSRWLFTYKELENLALLNHKVCISMAKGPSRYEKQIDPDVFYSVKYEGLKASSPYSELYYVANF